MALPYSEVKIAYKVMNELNLKNIHSFPPVWTDVEDAEKETPVEDKTYGSDKKNDNGWEELFFFKKNPTDDFIENWNKIKDKVANSSFQLKHEPNENYTCFGWF